MIKNRTFKKQIIWHDEDATEYIEVHENYDLDECLIRGTIVGSGFPEIDGWRDSYFGVADELVSEGYEEI